MGIEVLDFKEILQKPFAITTNYMRYNKIFNDLFH